MLKDRIKVDSIEGEIKGIANLDIPESMEPPGETERMILAAARKIIKMVEEKEYRALLGGIGASSLASWVAYYLLQKEGLDISLMSEIGSYGYKPFLGDPFVFNLKNLPTSIMHTDTLTLLGMLLSHEKNRCLGVLGAAQIDREGNINTTVIPEKKLFLLGSGGGNDIASQAEEVLVVTKQSKNRFVEKVPYITSPGKRVTAVISQFGIYEKVEGELVLTEVLGAPLKERAREAQENCRWNLKISPQPKCSPDPSPRELSLLRSFDPEKYFL